MYIGLSRRHVIEASSAFDDMVLELASRFRVANRHLDQLAVEVESWQQATAAVAARRDVQ